MRLSPSVYLMKCQYLDRSALRLIIDNIEIANKAWSMSTSPHIDVAFTYMHLSAFKDYRLTGSKIERVEASMEYTVHTLSLSEDHRHRIQMDSSFPPTPRIESTLRLSPHFNLPLSSRIL